MSLIIILPVRQAARAIGVVKIGELTLTSQAAILALEKPRKKPTVVF
jgi:hypothetical protein